MYIPLSDDKHQMVGDSSKKPSCYMPHVANPHAAVVFRMQPFNCCFITLDELLGARTCTVFISIEARSRIDSSPVFDLVDI